MRGIIKCISSKRQIVLITEFMKLILGEEYHSLISKKELSEFLSESKSEIGREIKREAV